MLFELPSLYCCASVGGCTNQNLTMNFDETNLVFHTPTIQLELSDANSFFGKFPVTNPSDTQHIAVKVKSNSDTYNACPCKFGLKPKQTKAISIRSSKPIKSSDQFLFLYKATVQPVTSDLLQTLLTHGNCKKRFIKVRYIDFNESEKFSVAERIANARQNESESLVVQRNDCKFTRVSPEQIHMEEETPLIRELFALNHHRSKRKAPAPPISQKFPSTSTQINNKNVNANFFGISMPSSQDEMAMENFRGRNENYSSQNSLKSFKKSIDYKTQQSSQLAATSNDVFDDGLTNDTTKLLSRPSTTQTNNSVSNKKRCERRKLENNNQLSDIEMQMRSGLSTTGENNGSNNIFFEKQSKVNECRLLFDDQRNPTTNKNTNCCDSSISTKKMQDTKNPLRLSLPVINVNPKVICFYGNPNYVRYSWFRLTNINETDVIKFRVKRADPEYMILPSSGIIEPLKNVKVIIRCDCNVITSTTISFAYQIVKSKRTVPSSLWKSYIMPIHHQASKPNDENKNGNAFERIKKTKWMKKEALAAKKRRRLTSPDEIHLLGHQHAHHHNHKSRDKDDKSKHSYYLNDLIFIKLHIFLEKNNSGIHPDKYSVFDREKGYNNPLVKSGVNDQSASESVLQDTTTIDTYEGNTNESQRNASLSLLPSQDISQNNAYGQEGQFDGSADPSSAAAHNMGMVNYKHYDRSNFLINADGSRRRTNEYPYGGKQYTAFEPNTPKYYQQAQNKYAVKSGQETRAYKVTETSKKVYDYDDYSAGGEGSKKKRGKSKKRKKGKGKSKKKDRSKPRDSLQMTEMTKEVRESSTSRVDEQFPVSDESSAAPPPSTPQKSVTPTRSISEQETDTLMGKNRQNKKWKRSSDSRTSEMKNQKTGEGMARFSYVKLSLMSIITIITIGISILIGCALYFALRPGSHRMISSTPYISELEFPILPGDIIPKTKKKRPMLYNSELFQSGPFNPD
ncbi:hypothetical protein SNEBB_005731 [Seison nebaliae]|nr:hypothetical protein SNEBB_005731 [Seison nebaliae]